MDSKQVINYQYSQKDILISRVGRMQAIALHAKAKKSEEEENSGEPAKNPRKTKASIKKPASSPASTTKPKKTTTTKKITAKKSSEADDEAVPKKKAPAGTRKKKVAADEELPDLELDIDDEDIAMLEATLAGFDLDGLGDILGGGIPAKKQKHEKDRKDADAKLPKGRKAVAERSAANTSKSQKLDTISEEEIRKALEELNSQPEFDLAELGELSAREEEEAVLAASSLADLGGLGGGLEDIMEDIDLEQFKDDVDFQALLGNTRAEGPGEIGEGDKGLPAGGDTSGIATREASARSKQGSGVSEEMDYDDDFDMGGVVSEDDEDANEDVDDDEEDDVSTATNVDELIGRRGAVIDDDEEEEEDVDIIEVVDDDSDDAEDDDDELASKEEEAKKELERIIAAKKAAPKVETIEAATVVEAVEAVVEEGEVPVEVVDAVVEEEKPVKKGRGRPSKKAGVTKEVEEVNATVTNASAPFGDLPPLEEFKRLMDALGPDSDSMFEDDALFGDDGDISPLQLPGANPPKYADRPSVQDEEEWVPAKGDIQDIVHVGAEKSWYQNLYTGGKPDVEHRDLTREDDWFLDSHNDPSRWRVKIVTVVTNSTKNSTAVEYARRVYEHIKAGTGNDDRIMYELMCFQNGEMDDPGHGIADMQDSFEELDDIIQMWIESYNTYHLIDGAAMKEAWGAIMPHIMLSQKNLDAILEQVQWALLEDSLDGALLTPRLRRVRFRGGAQEMITTYNTEQLDSEFSVVSVR